MKERGLWAAHLPPDLGGQGFGQVKLGLMHEILGTSPFAPACSATPRRTPATREILALAGTPDQKERYLHPLLAGDLRSAFSMTEPETAGSDPTLLQTRAVRDGDEWVINGHKWFSTNGSIADFLIVMAVTDPDARPHQRASMLIVDADTPGVNIVRDVPTMEHPAEHFGRYGGHAEIDYEDVRIPADALLGGEGEGFLIAQHRLGPGPHPPLHALARRLPARVRHALRARAVAATRSARCWPTSRRSRTGSRTPPPQMQAARLMTLHAAWKMDNEGAAAARTEISLIKFFGAERAARRRSTARCRSTARSATRPTCRWRRCTATRARRGSTTAPTRSTASRSRARSCAATSAARGAVRARPDPPRGGARALRGAARGRQRE